jgi:tRNA (guanine-N7-)-methyltransferase
MRMRKKKNLVPRMERCAAVQVKDGFALKGKWRESLMPQAREVHVELGCGKGRFTVETAAGCPDVLFIAIEKVPDALVVAMERAVAAELKNVFFVVGDAALLPDYFDEDEVDRIYINFCDPWPPKGQAKRRLTHRGFLESYRKVLKTGGQVHFKTDNRPLFDFSVLEFPEAGYELSEVTTDLHASGPCGVMTDYEAKFYAEGLPICRCVGTKR